MATQYDPIAKDGSLNTTEATPRNIADVLAEGLKGIEDALPPTYTEGDGIDISNDEISVDTTFTEASTRANIASGESFSTILGKIKKFFTDLKTVAFTGAYADLTGQPDLTNVAYKNVSNAFSAEQAIDQKNGTTSSLGVSALALGNNIPAGTDKNSLGQLTVFSNTSKAALLQASRDMQSDAIVKLPDAGGTLALTSDIKSASVTEDITVPANGSITYDFATDSAYPSDIDRILMTDIYVSYFYGTKIAPPYVKGYATATNVTFYNATSASIKYQIQMQILYLAK